jgi:hypothetical protein
MREWSSTCSESATNIHYEECRRGRIEDHKKYVEVICEDLVGYVELSKY